MGRPTSRILVTVFQHIRQLPGYLEWLLSVAERIVVLVIATLLVFGALSLTFFETVPLGESRLGQILELLDNNWKAFFILGVPLFYRPISQFLNRLRRFSIAGTTAEADGPEPEELENPTRV